MGTAHSIAAREVVASSRAGKIPVAFLNFDRLPYDDGSVDDMLDELHRAGFILRYQVGEQRLIQVLNFGKHRTPHHKEPASTIPAPDLPKSSPGQAPDLPKSSRADSLNPSTATSAGADPLPCPAEKIVDAYHRLMPDNPRCKLLNAARRGSIKARWNEAAKLACKPFGYSPAALKTSTTGRQHERTCQPPHSAALDRGRAVGYRQRAADGDVLNIAHDASFRSSSSRWSTYRSASANSPTVSVLPVG